MAINDLDTKKLKFLFFVILYGFGSYGLFYALVFLTELFIPYDHGWKDDLLAIGLILISIIVWIYSIFRLKKNYFPSNKS